MDNVFSNILGNDYQNLPESVRYFHEVPEAVFTGFAEVRGSENIVAKCIRALFSFPLPCASAPISVHVKRTPDLDQWRRDFAGRKFSSSFSKNSEQSLLSESFGPFRFYFSLSVSHNRMHWNFEKWSLGGLPLPKFLGPRITSWEGGGADGSYLFFSEACFPLLGQLIYYDGSITETEA